MNYEQALTVVKAKLAEAVADPDNKELSEAIVVLAAQLIDDIHQIARKLKGG